MPAPPKAALLTGLIRAAAVAAIAGAAAFGCSSTPPRDINFGTDLGADFRAPVVDAGGGDTATGGADQSAAGAGGQDDAGGQGNTGGQAGAGGAGGVTDLAGADGAAGAAGAGS